MSGDHNAHQNDFHPDWDTVKAFDDRHNEDTELLRQALEALETCEAFLLSAGFASSDTYAEASAVITALEERLK
jgi:hypothetical protein